MKYKGYFYFPSLPPRIPLSVFRFKRLIYKGKSVIPPNPLEKGGTREREREREKKKRDLRGLEYKIYIY